MFWVVCLSSGSHSTTPHHCAGDGGIRTKFVHLGIYGDIFHAQENIPRGQDVSVGLTKLVTAILEQDHRVGCAALGTYF